ncbi:multidrug ABC transporter, partial [Candidatus Entotheonella serta]
MQASNTAWMTLYSTLTLGLILWFGGLEVLRGHLTAGGLTQFVLYLSQLAFPIRVASRVINSFSRALSAGERLF